MFVFVVCTASNVIPIRHAKDGGILFLASQPIESGASPARFRKGIADTRAFAA